MLIKLLGSMKTAVIILILLILASAGGNFIPGIYRSWWFNGLLAFLALSLLRCVLKQLKKQNKNPGSLLTHAGLLIILLGTLFTAAFGEKGFISLYKGQSQDTIILYNNQPVRGAETAPLLKKLPFKIYLHDFIVDWYPAPEGEKPRDVKEFRSRLAVIENDNQVTLTKEVRVNHPLKYKGYAFYQSGYNPKDPDWTGLEVSRDPGIALVYGGFFLLNIGVIIIFYGRRK